MIWDCRGQLTGRHRRGRGQVECTVNGIGERAGNTSLEELIMVMRVRAEHYPYQT